jgi:hypothetical protein
MSNIIRWNPGTKIASQNLATPTVPPGSHYLFHTSAGDVCGQYEGETLLRNWLICGHYAKRADAETMLAAVRNIRPAVIEPWIRPTGKTSRRTYAVIAPDCTTEHLAALRSLIPAPIAPVAKDKKSCQADTKQNVTHKARRTSPSAHAAAEDIHTQASALGPVTYAMMLGITDTKHAAQVRERFLAAHQGQKGNWRIAWMKWCEHSPNITAQPQPPATTSAPVAPAEATPIQPPAPTSQAVGAHGNIEMEKASASSPPTTTRPLSPTIAALMQRAKRLANQ